MRPKDIYVTLYAGELPYPYSDPVKLDASNGWSYSWSGLPRKAGGQDIVYSIRELVVPEGYDSNVDKPDMKPTPTETPDGTTYISDEQYTVTNTHKPETVDVNGTKVWDDNNDQDGYRPSSVTVKLLADNEATGLSEQLTELTGWDFSFPDLPKYKFDQDGNGGQLIDYSVVEEYEDPDGKYTTVISGNVEEGFTITNTHEPEKTSVSATKKWDDNNNQDGIRPGSVDVQLYIGDTPKGDPVTLNEANGWTYTWEELDKFSGGSEIAYTVKEPTEPTDYTATVTGSIKDGFTVTNSHTPDVTTVKVKKEWNDSNDIDGIRPDSVQVQLQADGVNKGSPVTLNEENNWTYTWTELPVNKDQGTKIDYTVIEPTVPTDYKATVTGNAKEGYTVTNSHTPEVIEEFPISKSWIDNSNSEGYRPNTVKIQLLADGEAYGDPIVIGVDNDGKPLEGTTVDGNTWKYVFKNLPKYTYDENGNGGKEIVYSINEIDLDPNYHAERVDNRTIVNTIDAMKKDIPVKKVWDDADDQDGYRPDSVVFTLTGTVPSQTDPVYPTTTITLDESTNWAGTFKEVPMFYKGTPISYTVNEVISNELKEHYQKTSEGIEQGVYTITNTHIPEVTKITVGKIWDDANNQDGKRPASIEVTLTGNGKTYGPVKIGLDENGNPLEGTTVDGDTWTYTFENLPKKANKQDIDYVVSESEVDNYNQLSIISNIITNQHIPATISYSVVKYWRDFDNQDGKRPDHITVTLTGKVDGTQVYSSTIEVYPDEYDVWAYSFTGLNKYYNGKLIQYTLTEGGVYLYTTDDIVDVPTLEETEDLSNTIINRHQLETIDISVTKVWDDFDNKYNARPTFVKVHLLKDGDEIDSAVLNEANGWTTIFNELIKYREGEVGQPYEYTIIEDAVEYYKTAITNEDYDFTVTNTYDGPTESEIVPPKTGIIPTKDYTFYELLMNLILVFYSLVCIRRVED